MVKTFQTRRLAYQNAAPIRTTLYELIEAICEEVPPEENWVVNEVVLHLLRTGQIRLVGHPQELRATGA